MPIPQSPVRRMTAAVISAVLLAGCASSNKGPAASTSTTTATTAPSTVPTTTPQNTSTTTSASRTSTTLAPYASLGAYLPLYPFTSLANVQDWQNSFRTGGHQPWHLDAGQTALSFVAALGYSDIDSVISVRTDSSGAHVSVGFRPNADSGSPTVSAVIHLVRWGTGTDIPWEVVGTDDTTFSLDIPGYGTTVASPLTVGGRITGVDESIRVQVRTATSSAALGIYCCLPAGGTSTPWSVSVSFAAPSGTVLTLAAQTGGHVAAVERFAVTGVRSR